MPTLGVVFRPKRALPPGFEAVALHVEEAKAAVLDAVPAPRRPPPPLSDCLLRFDEALRAARRALEDWRPRAPEDVWSRCRDAVGEAARRGEWLRLEAPEMDFESLVLVLGDVAAPLDDFLEAEHDLRRRARAQDPTS